MPEVKQKNGQKYTWELKLVTNIYRDTEETINESKSLYTLNIINDSKPLYTLNIINDSKPSMGVACRLGERGYEV